MLLNRIRVSLSGDVVLLFQPAEENVKGAKLVIDAGLFEKIDAGAVFGLHEWPQHELGKVGLRSGAVLSAKDSFRIRVYGRSGHGSAPHRSVDPIPAGATLVMNLQALISREHDPLKPAVLSVCSIHAGNGDNVIPDSLSIEGSIRTMHSDEREKLLSRMRVMTTQTAAAYGCASEFNADPDKAVPAIVNHEQLHGVAKDTVSAFLGADAQLEQLPVLVSEDFAYYSQYAPSYYYLLGVGEQGISPAGELHNSGFYPNWRAACYAAALLAGSAVKYFEKAEKI